MKQLYMDDISCLLFKSSGEMMYEFIHLISRVFDNGPEDWGSIPGRV